MPASRVQKMFCLFAPLLVSAPAVATDGPPHGFQDTVVISGLEAPTNIAFSTDGRIFVSEKSGIIKMYEGFSDVTPEVFADLRAEVMDYWDRGLLGLAVSPDLVTRPWLYVLYAVDAPPGGTPPVYHDTCADPSDGTCVVTARLSRLRVGAGGRMEGAEEVLIEDWCQQFPSHSIGDIAFAPDGALLVSGGEGANFSSTDTGNVGPRVCNDPDGEGGGLRAQDLRSGSDPVALSGTVLRVNPDTGLAMPDNPLAQHDDVNARRIIAHGLRNPLRIAVRPGTQEIWLGDVGWNFKEEVNRIASPTRTVTNFGWPCWEGDVFGSGYSEHPVCTALYNEPTAVTAPHFLYNHDQTIAPSDGCANNGSSVTGLAFYEGSSYPAKYSGALFLADYARNCMTVMLAGPDGVPDPSRIEAFSAHAAAPVSLKSGPGGDIFYVEIGGGAVHRMQFFPDNRPPISVVTASPTDGSAPLTVHFSAEASSDPDPGDTLTYAWDLDGDGAFVDGQGVSAEFTYGTAGTYVAQLKVTDSHGVTGQTARVTISAGNTPPVVTIDAPAASTTWSVGQEIAVHGAAVDAQDGALPSTALRWTITLQHCVSTENCHDHVLQNLDGAGGTFRAPDHEPPCHLVLKLTATDSGGLVSSTEIVLEPRVVDLLVTSEPQGMTLSVGADSSVTPFLRSVIVGQLVSVSAPSPQVLAGESYRFLGWSDSQQQSHTVVIPDGVLSLKAGFVGTTPPSSPVIVTPVEGERLHTRMPVVSGTAQPDVNVRISVDGVELAVEAVGEEGTFSSELAAMTAGMHVVSAIAEDLRGRSAPSVVGFSIVEDGETVTPVTGLLATEMVTLVRVNEASSGVREGSSSTEMRSSSASGASSTSLDTALSGALPSAPALPQPPVCACTTATNSAPPMMLLGLLVLLRRRR